MELTFTINGRLGSLNEYIGKCRANAYMGAKYKASEQKRVVEAIRAHHIGKITGAISIGYIFYEENTRRDLDNVSGWAHKVVQDALVECGVIPDDNWKYITGYADSFYIDRANPRIEVIIIYG